MPELFTVVTPQEAWRRLQPHLYPITRVVTVRTEDGLDRVLYEDVVAPSDLPAFARSSMDGYAVRAEDTYGASESLPAYLTVVGEVAMGREAGISLSMGEAVLIHTGGMLPANSDAVVMVENTRCLDAGTLEVYRPVARGENVIPVGDDMAEGDVVMEGGSLLQPQGIGGLLGLGITEVAVYDRVKVALISTGDELVPPEQEPALGQIRNTNAYSLSGLATRIGAVPIRLGIVKDDYESLRRAAEEGRRVADLVVMSAGSSVSTRDMTAGVIGSLGEPGVLVHGVSIKPGKPTILAYVDGVPFFGLPGNPASAMLTFELFVTPAIYTLGGCKRIPGPCQVQARLRRNIPSASGREDYAPVRIEEENGELQADPIFGKSNLLSTLIRADGLGIVPLDRSGLAQGEFVVVRLF